MGMTKEQILEEALRRRLKDYDEGRVKSAAVAEVIARSTQWAESKIRERQSEQAASAADHH